MWPLSWGSPISHLQHSSWVSVLSATYQWWGRPWGTAGWWTCRKSWTPFPARWAARPASPQTCSQTASPACCRGALEAEKKNEACQREKEVYMVHTEGGRRSEIWGGGDVGDAVTGKMWQGICAHRRTQVGRKPQQAKSQLPREGDTYLSVSEFEACWSTECHGRKATAKTFKSSLHTVYWRPAPIPLILSSLSAFTYYSLVASKTRL